VRASARLLLLALLVITSAPQRLAAQGASAALRAKPELRADVIFGSEPALEIGGGIQLPLGNYVRVGATGALGTALGAGPRTRTGRADLLARFLLDPYRQSTFGLSAGGGVSARFGQGRPVTPLLLLALEVEGRRTARGWSPALQLGLGGGTRVGLVVRRGEARAR